jgi:hypothetical protein
VPAAISVTAASRYCGLERSGVVAVNELGLREEGISKSLLPP